MFPIRDLNPTSTTPLVTLGLIAASLFVFFFIQATGTPSEQQEFLYERAAISCEITGFEPLTAEEIMTGVCGSGGDPVFPEKVPAVSILASLFLHGGAAHVLFNMWFLWIFGNNVEEAYGHFGYLLMYLIGGVGATLTYVVMNPGSTVPLVGASGAIAAVLGAYAVLFPRHRVLTLLGWFVIPVPAAIFLGLWFIGQFGLGGTNVAWEAHAGGFVIGLVMTLFYRRRAVRRVVTAR